MVKQSRSKEMQCYPEYLLTKKSRIDAMYQHLLERGNFEEAEFLLKLIKACRSRNKPIYWTN